MAKNENITQTKTVTEFSSKRPKCVIISHLLFSFFSLTRGEKKNAAHTTEKNN